MSIVSDILTRCRDTLGDPDATRYANDSLLRIVNEGQYDIAKKAELFRATAAIALIKGQYLYEMPEDFIRLKGALFAQQPLEIIQAQQMDRRFGSDWRLHVTTTQPTVVVTDRQDSRKIRLYPRPFIDGLYDSYTFTPDTFGVTTEMTGYSIDSAFGTSGSIFDTEIIDATIDPFGIIVDGSEGEYLTIEYVRRPIKLLSIVDELELPDAFDTALVKYVTGTALRNDIDTQNRAMGNEELTFYYNELADIKGVSSQEQTTPAYNNTSEYRGMG